MLGRLFGRRRSKDDVKERLKLVLSYDRAKLSPGKMQELKTELLAVIGKYFPSDDQEYDVRFEQQGERMVLMANLPMSAGTTTGSGQEQAAAVAGQSGGESRSAQADQGNAKGGGSGSKSTQGKSRSKKRKN